MYVWLAFSYRIFHYLSFDVAIGACAGMYFFSRIVDVSLDGIAYLILALAVWVIYTSDHLLDARYSPGKLASPRHLFHRERFYTLAILDSLATVLVVVLAWVFLPSVTIFFAGAFLAGLILLGMLVAQYLKEKVGPFKEIAIAFLYVVGLILLPLMQGFENLTNWRWLHYAMAYLLLAWFNLVFLALLDRNPDKLAGQKSLVSALGVESTRRLLLWLGLGGLFYILSLFLVLPSAYHVFTLIILVLYLWHVRYFLEGTAPREEIRQKLEVAFLLPWVLILIG